MNHTLSKQQRRHKCDLPASFCETISRGMLSFQHLLVHLHGFRRRGGDSHGPGHVALLHARHLQEKGLSFECVTIGASSLILMDVISRGTKDCDVLDPSIPEEIKQALVGFSRRERRWFRPWRLSFATPSEIETMIAALERLPRRYDINSTGNRGWPSGKRLSFSCQAFSSSEI